MPLREHFRSPVRDLTILLPTGFRAAPRVHLGSPFEVDFTAYDLDSRSAESTAAASGASTFAALAPTLTVEADLTEQDEYEVRIYDIDRGRRLVAALEIVSPSNKDRPEAREVFVGKVACCNKGCACPWSIRSASGKRTCTPNC